MSAVKSMAGGLTTFNFQLHIPPFQREEIFQISCKSPSAHSHQLCAHTHTSSVCILSPPLCTHSQQFCAHTHNSSVHTLTLVLCTQSHRVCLCQVHIPKAITKKWNVCSARLIHAISFQIYPVHMCYI